MTAVVSNQRGWGGKRKARSLLEKALDIDFSVSCPKKRKRVEKHLRIHFSDLLECTSPSKTAESSACPLITPKRNAEKVLEIVRGATDGPLFSFVESFHFIHFPDFQADSKEKCELRQKLQYVRRFFA